MFHCVRMLISHAAWTSLSFKVDCFSDAVCVDLYRSAVTCSSSVLLQVTKYPSNIGLLRSNILHDMRGLGAIPANNPILGHICYTQAYTGNLYLLVIGAYSEEGNFLIVYDDKCQPIKLIANRATHLSRMEVFISN